MKILIWAYNKKGGPYDIERQLDYKYIFKELEDNYHANSLNIGNKVWIQGIISELSTPENELFFLDESENWEIINYKYDMIVYSVANMLCNTYIDVIDKVSELFKNCKIPVYVISIGAQADKYEEINNLVKETSRSVSRFIDTIYNTGGEIACRGYFTKEYLDKILKNTAAVVGCPSLFQNGMKLSVNKISERIKPVFNGQIPLEDLLQDFNEGIFIDQDEYLELLYNLDVKCDKTYVIENIIRFGRNRINQLLDGRIKLFYDIAEWKKFLENGNYNFSIGTRIHGSIMSLLSGVPAVIIPIDTRTREMAEFYNIPICEGISNSKDVINIYEKVDYDKFNNNYERIFENFNSFLKKCNLVKEINDDNKYWKKDLPLNNTLIDIKKDNIKKMLNRINKLDIVGYKLKNMITKKTNKSIVIKEEYNE